MENLTQLPEPLLTVLVAISVLVSSAYTIGCFTATLVGIKKERYDIVACGLLGLGVFIIFLIILYSSIVTYVPPGGL